MNISGFKPFITRKDMDNILTCLVNEKIDNGNISRLFSSAIAEYLGIEDGFLIKEYLRSIEIIFRSLELEQESVIILSPLSSFYYRKVIESLGLKIEYADIDPDTACVSYDRISEIIDKNSDSVKAVVVDSPLGFVPEIEKIRDTGLIVIEDISNLFGGEAAGQKCGSFGSYTIINLDPDKIITAAGGAFISANARKDKEKIKKIADELSPDILLPDVNCALGLSQIGNVEKHISLRKEIAEIYTQALMKTRYKTLIQKNDYKNIYYSFPVLIEGSSVKEIKKYAAKKRIQVNNGFDNSILDRFEFDRSCPNADKIKMKCVLFPLYPNIGKSNAEKVLKVLNTLP